MSVLSPGDRLSLGVTHQFTINGDDCWAKLEVNLAVREGEDYQDTYDRASQVLDARIESHIKERANKIIAIDNAKS